MSHEVPEDNMVLSVDTVLSGEGWSKKRTTSEGSHLLPDKTMVTKVHMIYKAIWFICYKDEIKLSSQTLGMFVTSIPIKI